MAGRTPCPWRCRHSAYSGSRRWCHQGWPVVVAVVPSTAVPLPTYPWRAPARWTSARKKLEDILRYFHTAENKNFTGNDKCSRIRKLAVNELLLLFKPSHGRLFIKESIIPCFGKHGAKRHIHRNLINQSINQSKFISGTRPIWHTHNRVDRQNRETNTYRQKHKKTIVTDGIKTVQHY